MAQKELAKKEIPLNGKLIESQDPATIAENFQTLTNLKYSGNHIQGIGGMTKINTTIMDSTHYKTRAAIHFKKDKPSESHVLVEAWNSGLTSGRILRNDTAIPNAGDFTAADLYTPASSSPGGRFSMAPRGAVAYANGKEACIWYGNEGEVSGFINYDPGGSYSYDFTEQVNNTLTDAQNIATLNSNAAGIDANAKLVLHLNNNLTDASASAHSASNHSMGYSSASYVFGTHSGNFGATTSSHIAYDDHADFDFSDGTFTIDTRINLAAGISSNHSIFYQSTNTSNHFNFYVDANGALRAVVTQNGSTHVTIATANGSITSAHGWYHVAVVENGDDWYLFIDGIIKAYLSSANRAANYTGQVTIGYDGTDYYGGLMDEYRVSQNARWTNDFEVPVTAYSDASGQVNIYFGSRVPLQGFKFYIGTANTASSSMHVYYWSGSAWTAVSSLSDGTVAAGKSLAQTGSVTFTSTAAVAKVKYIDGVVVYWYKIVIDDVSANTSVYYATMNAAFQTIKDIWDGVPRSIDTYLAYEDSKYTEYTLNVRENIYDSADTGTFMDLDSLVAGTEYILCGFTERMMGVNFYFVGGKENSTANTICTVYYWNGTAWTSVGTIDDGTAESGISFAKTGAITWNAPGSENEFTQEINNMAQLYYYKFVWNQNFDAEVELYHISGIPAQKDIGAYNFPFFGNDRLWLVKENKILCSAEGTPQTFNGDDSLEIEIGDDSILIGAAWLYSQFGSSLYNVSVWLKKNETWALVGNGPDDWIKYRISDSIGCVAPNTIKLVNLAPEVAPDINRNVVIWQGPNGVYMSDGRAPIALHGDISNYFDKRDSNSINNSLHYSYIDDSVAAWDEQNQCYHWSFGNSSVATLNLEKVIDFSKPGWFTVERGTGKTLQHYVEVEDTDGNTYVYGFLDTGYMLRLNFGNTMDGTAITHTFQFGDIALDNGLVTRETNAEYAQMVMVAKSTTTNTATITHYGDGSTTASADTLTMAPQKSGYRIAYPVKHQKHGAHVFHSWKSAMTTNNENVGFEPLYFAVQYSIVREHRQDWRS